MWPATKFQLIKLLLLPVILGIFISCQNSTGRIHSPTSAHPTYKGLSMTGYQGWFGTPDDSVTNEWRHYNKGSEFKPGMATIEFWPDMREADEDEKYETVFKYNDGSTAYVFSSVHPKTVSRHFRWMKEYGIDGAFMQRFRSDFHIKPTLNIVLKNGLYAARKHGRAFALMYDLTATNVKIDGVPNDSLRKKEVDNIFNDWKELVDNLALTTVGEDQPYLYHNGKPLVAFWGLGFDSRHGKNGYDVQFFADLVDLFQNDPTYGGCSIMLGVVRGWRTADQGSITGTEYDKMIELIKKVDIIQAWHTSGFGRLDLATKFKDQVQKDIEWCNTYGIEYAPTLSPGMREKILQGNNFELDREGGYYFWDMAKAAIEAGSKSLYLGMFDEIDEGTQYHKIDNNPPFYSKSLSFVDYETDPEDHYLWLAGEATRALKGEFIMGPTFRKRAESADFKSGITVTDKISAYEMKLVSDEPGRKIYYADPYKVPDGAPTAGTVRDTSLFYHELASETVTFDEAQEGLFIRFVETDAATDKIISFKAIRLTRTNQVMDVIVEKVKKAMLCMQRYSWEHGIAMQAMQEIGDTTGLIIMARESVQRKKPDGRLSMVGSDMNIADTGVNGPGVLAAYKITGEEKYKKAAQAQYQYLKRPQSKNVIGVIYHNNKSKAIFSDNMFMVAPFLAQMGDYDEAIHQIEGIRGLLWNKDKKLFHHIRIQETMEFKDPSFWGGGNGWCAAAMAQVINSLPDERKPDSQKVIKFCTDLLDGCIANQLPSGLFYDKITESNFEESTLPAMLAYTIYTAIRSGWLDPSYKIPADKMRSAVYANVDDMGLLQNASNAPRFNTPGTSPEGQAFFLMMEGAFRKLNKEYKKDHENRI